MLILCTGVPGAGKTLNTIRMVCEEDRFKNRPVFYHGIPDCTVPGWTEVKEDQIKRWDELGSGSILIIDEAYTLFPALATGAKVPDYIERLARSRHYGMDVIFICQHPHQLVTFVRKLIGNHYHFERPFGMKYARRLEWQKVQNDPDDHFARKDALVTKIRQDKKYFGVYKSAEVHTHKARVPKKLVGVLALLLTVVGGLAFFVMTFGQTETPSIADMTPASALDSFAETVSSSGGRRGSMPADPVAYAEQFAPRLDDVPFSAPAYDSAFQVKSFPRPQCVLSESSGRCQCYSQQGTRLDIGVEMCVSLVNNGWFDPTREDRGEGDRQPSRQVAHSGPELSSEPSGRRVLIPRARTNFAPHEF